MAYLPDGTPGVEPTIDDAPFWESCAKRELRFQRCSDCGRFRHPPAPACAHCHSFRREWVPATGDAVLFSYTVVHYPAHPAVEPALPYNVALVHFPSLDEVRIVSNVIDARPDELRIGMKLALAWEEDGEGTVLPRFRRA